MTFYESQYLETLAELFGMTAYVERSWLQRNFPTLAKYYTHAAESQPQYAQPKPIPAATSKTIHFTRTVPTDGQQQGTL